jgi:putative endonuclease
VRVAHALGRFGEQVAADHLQQAGLEILARNWRCRDGELDIVAWDPQERCVVFCEVKTRSGLTYGSPAEAVTMAKARRLRRLAAAWLAEPGSRRGDIRFDIVEVLRDRRAPLQITHLRQVI